MEFRWVAIIALWTILSGPVFGPPTGSARPKATAAASNKRIKKATTATKRVAVSSAENTPRRGE